MASLLYNFMTHIRFLLVIFMMSALTVKGLSQIDSARTMQYVIEDHSFLWKNNVPLSGYSYRDPMINASVIKTVRLHKKSDSKLAMGMIFSSVGVLITGFALLDDLSSPEPGGNVTISESYGPAPLAVTGVLLGVSLPFFISSISNKRKMEESLVETKRLLVQ